jgi:hypothetical protein
LDVEVKKVQQKFDRWRVLLDTSNTADVAFQVAHEGGHFFADLLYRSSAPEQ